MTSKGRQDFRPLKSFKPITNERHARKATSDFHNGKGTQSSYQAASALLTDLHKTSSKFVFRCITKLGLRPKSNEAKLEVLEIGAINVQLLSSSFLNVLAIDINSRHPLIKQMDFFDMPPPPSLYKVVVLAMVLNCVPTKEKRGEMLVKCREMLQEGALFVLILPKRCFANQSLQEFHRIITTPLGFKLVVKEETPKVTSLCYQVIEPMNIVKRLSFSTQLFEVQLNL
jgi:hypothetical protein